MDIGYVQHTQHQREHNSTTLALHAHQFVFDNVIGEMEHCSRPITLAFQLIQVGRLFDGVDETACRIECCSRGRTAAIVKRFLESMSWYCLKCIASSFLCI